MRTVSALGGIRVLELGAFQVGPLAALLLSELGCEVIKIEGLPGGDPVRGAEVLTYRDRPAQSYNWSCEYYNRNKRSVALELGNETATKIIYRLVEKTDVFITNLRISSLTKWGVDYDSLKVVNPMLIYAHGTGFGVKGKDIDLPVLDMIGQARGGILSMMGDLEGLTMVGGWTPCDKVAALELAFGVLAALIHRDRTGQGQRVDSSLLGAAIYLGGTELQYYLGSDQPSLVVNRRGVANPLRNLYRTKDNEWIVFNMTQGDRYWPKFCKAVGIEHLEKDPRFESMQMRSHHRQELISILDQVFSTKTRHEWENILAHYGLIWSPVKRQPEVAVDPQVLENRYIIDFDHPNLGRMKITGGVVGFSETPPMIRTSAPELGQHTEEVLLEIAGYTWAELEQFKKLGAII